METAAILSDAPAVFSRPRGRSVAAGLVATAGFVALLLLTVIFAHRSTRLEDDQNRFHLPTIRQFAAELPTPSVRDYRAATTPGYHLVLAVVARCGGDLTALRIAGSVFGVLLVFATAYFLHQIGGAAATWLCLPLMTSVYVLTSAGWLLPEDAAWLLTFVLISHGLRAQINVRYFIVAALVLALLIFTRQSAVWAAFPVITGAMVGEGRWSALRRAAGAAASMLPAIAILTIFFLLWRGLVPPAFQASADTNEPWLTHYGGVSFGSALMTLAMIGLFGAPLIGWFWRGRAGYRSLLIGAAVGLLIGLALPSSAHFPERRSGIWTIVGHLPTVAARSPLMIILTVVGSAITGLGLSAVPKRTAWVLATMLIGFIAVQTANPFLWQRYYEPFAILWIALLAASSIAPKFNRARIVGLACITAWQLAVWVYFVFFAVAE